MKIGWDLDGVCYDFVGALRDVFIKRGFGKEALPNPSRWGFWRDWGCTKEEFHMICHEATNAHELFRHGYMLPGVAEAFQILKNNGHTNHIVTARWYGDPFVASDSTRLWLTDNDLAYDTVDFCEDKTLRPVDVFIEDNVDNYDKIEAAGIRAYLFNQPSNQRLDDTRRRVDTLDEFVYQVLRFAEELEQKVLST